MDAVFDDSILGIIFERMLSCDFCEDVPHTELPNFSKILAYQLRAGTNPVYELQKVSFLFVDENRSCEDIKNDVRDIVVEMRAMKSLFSFALTCKAYHRSALKVFCDCFRKRIVAALDHAFWIPKWGPVTVAEDRTLMWRVASYFDTLQRDRAIYEASAAMLGMVHFIKYRPASIAIDSHFDMDFDMTSALSLVSTWVCTSCRSCQENTNEYIVSMYELVFQFELLILFLLNRRNYLRKHRRAMMRLNGGDDDEFMCDESVELKDILPDGYVRVENVVGGGFAEEVRMIRYRKTA